MKNYKQKYEEALERCKKEFDFNNLAYSQIKQRLERIFPELKENGDDKIRKAILELVKQSSHILNPMNQKSMISWIEKQGDVEYVFRPLAGCDIYSAAESAVEQQKSGKKIILAFNGAYIPVDKKTADEIVNEYYSWCEKQGEPQVRTGSEWVRTIDDACEHRYAEEYAHGEYCHQQSFRWGFQEGVDWLEKQREQKPTDKVEPKFKAGDWIVTEHSNAHTVNQVVKIEQIDDRTFGYTLDNGTYFSGSWEDSYRLWTIKDAKDGDVLYECNEKKPFIFKELKTKHIGDIASYCDIFNGIFNPNEDNWTTLDIVPATKEQCDLLFSKMKEAGYEWDAKKKESKQIEQEDDTELTDFESALFSAFSDAWQEYLSGEEVDVEKWTRDHSAELLEVAREQNTAWSEEDEPQKELAETYLTVFDKKFPILPTLRGKQLADYKNFLNKCQQIFGLKYWGIRPLQAKLFEKLSLLWAAWGAEHLQGLGQTNGDTDNEMSMWSEEDENMLNFYEKDYNNLLGDWKAKDVIEMRMKFRKWLKSLKQQWMPQPHWKPSDEQLRPLGYAIDYFKKKKNDTTYLESLYNDLKKL